jgi:hypothetical protein
MTVQSGGIAKAITGTPKHFYYSDNDWFVFGGSTTFLQGDSKKRVFIDWAGQKKTFGYVNVWTPTKHCKTERGLSNERNGKFGTQFTTTYSLAEFKEFDIGSQAY